MAIACSPADADAHDENLRRRHGAGRRHHHRQRATVLRCSIDDRLVAGEVRLRRQHVHRLRARDARHQFHRECRDIGCGDGTNLRFVAVGIHRREHERARLVAAHLGLGRPAHLQHDVGVEDGGRGIGRDGRAGGLVVGVGEARLGAGARLNGDGRAEADEFLHRLRRCGNARLVLFRRDGDLHRVILGVSGQLEEKERHENQDDHDRGRSILHQVRKPR